jgi:uncharacterized C2H2 Zn-finger protein
MSLDETRRDGYIVIRCKHCSTILAEIQEDGRKGYVIGECKHFQWNQVRTLCFDQYYNYPDCDADYVWRLRKRYVMRLDDGEMFFLLIPREAEEG